MANKILDQALPPPLMLKSSYPDEAAMQESLSENISEASSHDSFYDSLSDLNEDSTDANFPELSAFLSQDEMNKSLDIAREAFSGSKHEEPFQEHFVNPPPLKSWDGFKDLKPSNTGSEGLRKQDNITRNNVHNSQNTIHNASCKVAATDVRKMISPLLTTSPSIIRTLQAQKASKNMGKCEISKTPIPKARAKALRGETGTQNNDCTKAATFIDELSAIFRETTKARNKRANGDSSSPDSGYLSPKKDMSMNMSSSVSENEFEIKQALKPKDRQCIKAMENTFQEIQSQSNHPQEKVINSRQCIKGLENSFEEIQSQSNQPEEKVIHGPKYIREMGNSFQEIQNQSNQPEEKVIHSRQCIKGLESRFQEIQSRSNLPEEKVIHGPKYIREMGNSFQEIQSQPNLPDKKVIHGPQYIREMGNTFQEIQNQSNLPEEKVIHGTQYIGEMGNIIQEIQSQSNLPEENVIQGRQCIKGMENSFQQIQSQSNQPEEKVIVGPANKSDNPLAAARFIQKLRSQEVAEGSRVKLECRATGNPLPEIRWFCEGKELSNSPDIHISSNSNGLHTLVIREAFEEDTGRYTCVASNTLGSDTSSAEIFVEGASSSDSESESFAFKSKQGAMPQAQKKTSSVSLTIGPSSPKCGITTAVMQPISIPVQQVRSPTSYLYRQDRSKTPTFCAPAFTKELQNLTASDGQVVVLECRVKGTPPVKVKWFRQGIEIQDSPDFRILQKKPRCASEPEEICTLVIAETFPEDAGIFTCTASNDYGLVSCNAQLTVLSENNTHTRNNVSSEEISGYDSQKPSPLSAIPNSSCLEVSSKKNSECFQTSQTDSKANIERSHFQFYPVENNSNGVHANNGVNGDSHNVDSKYIPVTSPCTYSPTKGPPPVPTKPKLDTQLIQQLQNQIRLEQEGVPCKQGSVQLNTPPSPSFPPPPSFQELEASQLITSPEQMNVLDSHNSPMQPASSFNYARPKQFIAAQNISPTSGYMSPSSGSSTSSLPSPMSPSTPQKQFGRPPVPPFTQPFPQEGEQFWSPASSSPPPPPPPVLSPTANYSVVEAFPLPPPPPPPLPVSALTPSYSPSPSPTGRAPSSSQSPAAFISSMLPPQPSPITFNELGLPKGVMPPGFPKKSGRTARIASDEEIQGTKDAVIQDLERKLRFKEELMNNGQPKLTYEEKMARRLLGADNAATVFNIQEPEEDGNAQEYKVSSFEQRLISEIEYRLERSPVEESDEEVEHGDEPVENGEAPQFETKLKHYKIFEGMPSTFTCMVTGNPKPKIYWFKDGKQISKRSEHYRIQREADGTCSLHTAASSLDDDGNYTIMAANPQGRISCTGRLMVQAVNQRGRTARTPTSQLHVRRPRSRSRDSGDENEPIQERFFRPHFLQAPGDLIVQEGKLCRMDCKVSGLPTPDLSWEVNGRPIRPDNSHKMLVRENGVHSLVIEPVTTRDAGIYTCVASNRAGQNSFTLELIVAAKDAHKPPVFIEKLQNTGVAEGYPVRLECRVSGMPPPQIFWKKENESLTYSTERVSMHQDNYGYLCLLIQGATKEDAGWYTVSAKNEAGIVSCTARLDVHTQWHQQSLAPKTRKVRPSASRYAALSDQGLDIKAAFLPEANPVYLQPALVESEDL
ncbi:palladin isoform X2 [Xenopus laevis]|uniref:Palladin n=2 Tax=Xenopus laevis TaxID=8355 RepID=A0A8J0TJ32_XENLA|nr:palladin isoform X2 [Xenopus laevis]